MPSPVDYDLVREILESNPPGDPCASYYRQYEADYEIIGPLVPDTRTLLEATFEPSMHVLDLGCGRGDTLLDCASRFRLGTGIDDSEDVMLAAAKAERARRGVENVEFRFGRSTDLPLPDASVDFLFTERGPLGRRDATLVEALRVIRPGGLVFIETIGERNSWETTAAFDPGFETPAGSTEQLLIERDRFERHGVEILTLASRIRTIRFPDFHEWLRFQSCSWNPPERERLTVECKEEFEKLLSIAADSEGRVNITQHTIWIAGRRPA